MVSHDDCRAIDPKDNHEFLQHTPKDGHGQYGWSQVRMHWFKTQAQLAGLTRQLEFAAFDICAQVNLGATGISKQNMLSECDTKDPGNLHHHQLWNQLPAGPYRKSIDTGFNLEQQPRPLQEV